MTQLRIYKSLDTPNERMLRLCKTAIYDHPCMKFNLAFGCLYPMTQEVKRDQEVSAGVKLIFLVAFCMCINIFCLSVSSGSGGIWSSFSCG